jgi:hypothetical protein
MANGDNSADPMRRHAETLANSVRERAALVAEVGERTARIVTEAIENYARQTESVMAFCEQTAEQCKAAAAQLEPLAGRPAPIDTDKMEREIREAPVTMARMPMPSRGAPR